MVLQTGGRKSRKTAELIGPFRRDAGAKKKIFTSLMLFKKYRITTKILSNLRFYVKFKLHYKYFEFKLSLKASSSNIPFMFAAIDYLTIIHIT